MKCQILCSREKERKYFKISFAIIIPRMLNIKGTKYTCYVFSAIITRDNFDCILFTFLQTNPF